MSKLIFIAASLLFISNVGTAQPYLCFTDLISGPATGNSDVSIENQVANKDGAIVTLWGKNLGTNNGSNKVLIGNKEARIYSWANAYFPADLYTMHRMQSISFQIPGELPKGLTSIKVIVDNKESNALPFRIIDGNIYFVMKDGNDESGDGSWTKPWASLDNKNYTGALEKIKAGDIVYVGDFVRHDTIAGDRACIDIGNPGTREMPKAIIAYPGAYASIGNEDVPKTISLWVSGIGLSSHWVISKLHLTAMNEAIPMFNDFRVVGNKITAPKGDGPTGAVAGLGNQLYLLGNELTNIGYKGTSKLYHPIYFQSAEACQGQRLPTERDREIAWNYLHDNLAFDGINIYRECGSSAYMTDHRVHDNVIQNQTGCGIRCGDYVVGENHFYNNLVINAGLGPDPLTEQAMHVPVYIHAGWEDTITTIHFYNNTIYGGGFKDGAAWASSMVAFAYNHPFNLDFRNNIVVTTDAAIQYLNPAFPSPSGVENNIWQGQANAPSWEQHAVEGSLLFEDVANHDFRIKKGSVAIDNASPQLITIGQPSPKYDFDCTPRPQGINNDIGAYEYTQKSTTFTDEEVESSLAISPNPTSGKLWINTKNSIDKIELYDLAGRMINTEKKCCEIDMTEYRNGIYVLKLILTNGDHMYAKILKL